MEPRGYLSLLSASITSLGILSLAARPTRAQVKITPATFYENAGGVVNPRTDIPGSASSDYKYFMHDPRLGFDYSVDSYAMALTSGGTSPMADVQGFVHTRGISYSSFGKAWVTYAFRIKQTAPLPPGVDPLSVLVPITITAHGQCDPGGSAEIIGGTLSGGTLLAYANGVGAHKSFDLAMHQNFPLLGSEQLTLYASGQAATVGILNTDEKHEYQSVVDPTITIDPGFVYKNDLQIVYSPNLFPTVPEPSAWLALVASVTTLVAVRRRHRSTAQPIVK